VARQVAGDGGSTTVVAEPSNPLFFCNRLGLLWAKALVKAPLGVVLPIGGTTEEKLNLRYERFLGENLSNCGRASTAPLASRPPWRCRLLDLTCSVSVLSLVGEGYFGCVARWVVVARPWLSLWCQSATSASIAARKLEDGPLDSSLVKV
jgi:hypothetical protein